MTEDAAVIEAPAAPVRQSPKTTGSLSRRMILIAAAWIALLLAGGGFALDRVLVTAVTRNFDDQLEYVLTALIVSADIGPDGEVLFNREPADQRFLEPYSGLYWQVSAPGQETLRVAIAVGPAAAVRRRRIRDRASMPMTACSSATRSCASSNAT